MMIISKAEVLGYFLLALNLVAFFLMGYDKNQARHNRWRISEKTLWFFILSGGSLGAWLAMKLFSHKNQKRLFKIGIPCCVVLQWGYLLYRYL